MAFEYNDGGREAAGFKGKAGDCVVRAIAIAMQKPYKEVYNAMRECGKAERRGKRGGRSNPRGGVFVKRKWFKDWMQAQGWEWVCINRIGQASKTHLTASELPTGRLICATSKHYVAFINGVVNDTFDSSRGGSRMVYGYWREKGILENNKETQ